MDQPHIIISGAGLAGSLMAIYFAKRGWKVDIYESRKDMRTVEMSAGRSINLALSDRGLLALKEVGIEGDILEKAIPMPGRMLHDREGNLKFAPYGKDNHEHINSISRSGLNILLMDAAEAYDDVKIHFNHEVMSVNFEENTLEVQDSISGSLYKVKGDLLVAGDGANSAIRRSMEKQLPTYQSNVDWLTHGYKELTIPAAKDGSFRIEKHALHIWPRGQYMLIALPNFDGSFTCTLFFPNEGENSFASIDTPEKVRSFFEQEFADAVPHLTNLEHEFINNPVGKLGTLKCYPWVYEQAVLIGDAAHAIVPFYGQGMNSSFEDCRILNACIEKAGTNWEEVLSEYQRLRKINGDAIGDLAVENYHEMRDHVANPTFRKKREIEYVLERRYDDYHSKYSLVTFHPEIPYAVARNKGNKQDDYLMNFCEKLESLDYDKLYHELMAL